MKGYGELKSDEVASEGEMPKDLPNVPLHRCCNLKEVTKANNLM